MKLKSQQRAPVLIAFSLLLLVCLVRCLQFEFLEQTELVTYDMRVRQAAKLGPPVATNLAFVYIDETTISNVWSGSFGYRFGLYWPRQVYGRIVNELGLQGVKSIALDVLFAELRPDHARVVMQDGSMPDSDEFFALQMRYASNVVLAVTEHVTPPPLFATNALALGDITTERDPDGILRRVKVFRMYRKWHRLFQELENQAEYGVDLRKAIVRPREIVLPRGKLEPIRIPLDAEGRFAVSDFVGDKLPPGMEPKEKPFTEKRVWHMGVILAAAELGLNLETAEVDLARKRIVLHGAGGKTRVLPVDSGGHYYIDWGLTENDPRLMRMPADEFLALSRQRAEAGTNLLVRGWQDRLVVVGSSAVAGNDLADRGATPLSPDGLLVAKHWNVANSILINRFVRRAPLPVELAFVAVLALLTAVPSHRLRPGLALAVVALFIAAYVGIAFSVYVRSRYWMPIAVPVLGAFLTCLCLVAWRVVFEESERRRIRSVFSKMVSPKIVNELLATEELSLGGARREVTILFADVRGFTALTDDAEERAAEHIRRNQLTGPAAAACFDEQAKRTLDTVNLYLATVADLIIKNDGTLDKFIGDCVMAFWGAPATNARHATACVHTAIQAQRAVYGLNLQRVAENKRREVENLARVASGLELQPLLPILMLGSGINTGLAAAGLMGSAEAQSLSYTVFGREVNLASRLEGASGRGRIFISKSTHKHLLRDDPALAQTCVLLEPVQVKGFRLPVTVYEVPWMPPGAAPLGVPDAAGELSYVTGFFQRGTY